MKTSLLTVCFLINASLSFSQNVAIGTDTPNASAQLEVNSSNKGFLPPRMTFLQRNAIQNPAAGLVIYCNDCDELDVYNGTIWKNINGFAACSSPFPSNVKICNQVWMNKNLDVSTYKNGDTIPNVNDPLVWYSLTTGAYCYISNDSATYGATYGKLYNSFAVSDPRGLAPAGWHIPSDEEWTTLSNCLGGDAVAGGKMKEAGTTHWTDPNVGATNSSGFSGLPAGYRIVQKEGQAQTISDAFFDIGILGLFWSIDGNTNTVSVRYLRNELNAFTADGNITRKGFSVRCVKD